MCMLTMALVGCGNGNVNQGPANNKGTVTNEGTSPISTSETTQDQTAGVEAGVLGNKYKVEFGEAEKVRSEYIDNDLLLVHYTFTNNSQDTVAADTALMLTAYQDGIEVEQVFDIALTGDNSSKNIKPGNSLECKALFMLSSTSDVEVDATEFLGMDGSMVTKVYTLQ